MRPLFADAELLSEAVSVEPFRLEALLLRMLPSALLFGMGMPATASDLTTSASSCSPPRAAASCRSHRNGFALPHQFHEALDVLACCCEALPLIRGWGPLEYAIKKLAL